MRPQASIRLADGNFVTTRTTYGEIKDRIAEALAKGDNPPYIEVRTPDGAPVLIFIDAIISIADLT